jgi:hypothetical protein
MKTIRCMKYAFILIGILLTGGMAVMSRQDGTATVIDDGAQERAADRLELPSSPQPSIPSDVPLSSMAERPALLTFGLYVTPDPAQNPIDPPERFTGFHTGVDFEILEAEQQKEVPVSSICAGPVLFSGEAEGYGGVVVQTCTLKGRDVSVLYGHLLLSSLVPPEATLQEGQRIAVLAPARSKDSGGTRKHLHLGLHKGAHIELLGYVQDEQALAEFIDPLTVLSIHDAALLPPQADRY